MANRKWQMANVAPPLPLVINPIDLKKTERRGRLRGRRAQLCARASRFRARKAQLCAHRSRLCARGTRLSARGCRISARRNGIGGRKVQLCATRNSLPNGPRRPCPGHTGDPPPRSTCRIMLPAGTCRSGRVLCPKNRRRRPPARAGAARRDGSPCSAAARGTRRVAPAPPSAGDTRGCDPPDPGGDRLLRSKNPRQWRVSLLLESGKCLRRKRLET